AVTNSGRAKVMSRSRHSSSECLGGSKTWSVSSSLSWPVKSSIGEMSRKTSATPSSRNQRNESVCTSMRLGSSFTSRSFEKERRSRDARRANVTPIRRESNCGNAELRAELRVVQRKASTQGSPDNRARVGKGLEDRRAQAGRHGSSQHSEKTCRVPATAIPTTTRLRGRVRMFGAG